MWSCEITSVMVVHKSSKLPLLCRFHPHNNHRFRLPVCSSLSSVVFTSANVIAAAAKGPGSLHGAVASALSHVAVTAFAIASGACLSTRVHHFLWPARLDEQPGSLVVDGVDVTGCPIFNDPKVREAIAFAKKAHDGQLRRTGDPYLTHCIHTGRILAMLVPPTGTRAIDTIVAGILHDVVDDTAQSLRTIEEEFGEDVAKLVAGVSRLSYINQLLRRHRRVNVSQVDFSQEEANKLRVMLLGMVDDPRVVLIKLADRLHNMRTIYALPPPKAQHIAQETLVIWCSLASRLGLWALKAELEDLCFAVIQPQVFQKMRSDLASMWSPTNKVGNHRRMLARASTAPCEENNAFENQDRSFPMEESTKSMQVFLYTFSLPQIDHLAQDEIIVPSDLVDAVVPFDVLLDRRKRSKYIMDIEKNSDNLVNSKVVRDTAVALASMVACEEALERELLISTSYVPGMEVTLSSRLKSLYSIYSKMKRKDVSINKVHDARALRVVIGDKNGSLHGPAVQCCYSFLDIVHRLWAPIDGEFDDYIVNPKATGYQSLHTAVLGPDCSPLEVQIRTQKMHEYAEHGNAAHWIYKENVNLMPSVSNVDECESSLVRHVKDHNTVQDQDDLFRKYGSLKAGHPVLRVEGSHLLTAVVVRRENGGKELLVAVSFGSAASAAVADRRSSFQIKRWEAYARLYKKVSDEWWCEPGHGDWCTCLERYILCRDGMYHKQDQFERLLPTFIQIIELTEQEGSEYWSIVTNVFEGKEIEFAKSRPSEGSISSSSCESGINNKVQLLRTMLQWEEQFRSEAISGLPKHMYKMNYEPTRLGEVVIVCWPRGEIMRLGRGSTAGDAARRVGLEGKLVVVNGQLVLPCTELRDGDVVEVRL